jgi:hypothetical protein
MSGTQLLFMLAAVAIVVLVGIVMAAMGASSDTYMALVAFAAGIAVAGMVVRYYRNPTYVMEGQTQTVGQGMLLFMAIIAIVLLAGGIYIALYGLSQPA